MKISLLLYSFTVTQQAFAQVSDDFSDGDFTSSPVWSGDSSKFSVVSQQLKLLAPAVNDDAYLSTPSAAINSATWEFYVKLEFNPSSSNYGRIYLVSDQPDVSVPLNGYFVSIGSSSDEISLYKQTGTTITEIIDGTDNALNVSTAQMKVKVTRDDSGNWQLFSDVGLTSSYTTHGSAIDSTHSASSYFGVYCLYTSTRSDKFYFDSISVVGDPFTDNVPPEWNSLTATSSNSLQLNFSEALDDSSVSQLFNYITSDSINPGSASLLADKKTVLLNFDNDFPNGIEQSLTVSGIQDTVLNELVETTKPFLYFNPVPTQYKDVVITEIFPDFSPTVGLPESEFLEIFNRSENPIQLQNWILTDGSSNGILPAKILLPSQYVILTNASGVASYSQHGETLLVNNFPSLNNTSDALVLRNDTNLPIDSVRYSAQWYQDEDKQAGGWTLELIDPDNFCKGDENWIASHAGIGGTPGQINSVDQDVVDTTGIKLLSIIKTDTTTLLLAFDERLEDAPIEVSGFQIDPYIDIASFKTNEDQKSVSLFLATSVIEGKTYKITVSGIKDCPGNVIEPPHNVGYLHYDTLSPKINKISVLTSKTLSITFSEKLSQSTAEDVANYFLTEIAVNPVTATLQNNDSTVILEFYSDFPNGNVSHIEIRGVEDINENPTSLFAEFVFFVPSPVDARDIIISEIFPDPTPVIGMPEGEFIELFNRSENPIDLSGWTLSDATTISVLKSWILMPGDFIILSSSSASSAYANFGKTLALSPYPVLTNTGEPITLKDPSGILIDSVYFSSSWYRNAEKKDGGYSLERIDPNNFCKGSLNWIASISDVGATPGQLNSVDSVIIDHEGPIVQIITLLDSLHFQITFNELLGVLDRKSIVIKGEPEVDSIYFSDTSKTSIIVRTTNELSENRMYELTLVNIIDCEGNVIHESDRIVFLNPDFMSPVVTAHRIIGDHSLELVLNESADTSQINVLANFQLTSSSAHPASLEIVDKKITVRFEQPFLNGVVDSLTFQIFDINGNSANGKIAFRYFKESPVLFHDIIITEILSDPTPPISLPEYEFIELHNRSSNPINLKNFYLADATSVAILPEYFLLPNAYVIVTSSSGFKGYSTYGPCLKLSNFPSLSNAGERISLLNTDSLIIDQINYTSAWYRDIEKKDGGWTLERIDRSNFCKNELNWMASTSENGGTPATLNAVDSIIVDIQAPRLQALTLTGNTVDLIFDESLNMNQLPNINISPLLPIDSFNVNNRSVLIFFSDTLADNRTYQVTVDDLMDCEGNLLESPHNVFVINQDSIGPLVIDHQVTSPATLTLAFSENVDAHSLDVLNYELLPGNIRPTYIVKENDDKVLLTFQNDFQNGLEYKLIINNITDINGNINNDTLSFLYFEAKKVYPRDVIVIEIFSDPAPIVGLPESEFVELFNRSPNPISLEGWQLSDGFSSAVLTEKILLPNEYIIICSITSVNMFSPFGMVMGVTNFPSLNNSADNVVIKDKEGNVIDSVFYQVDWHSNDENREGGWSLELRDPESVCLNDLNWTTSIDTIYGGTPGQRNSVYESVVDLAGPLLETIIQLDSITILLTFNERLQSTTPLSEQFQIVPGLVIDNIEFTDQNLMQLKITTATPIIVGKSYKLHMQNVSDCSGNLIAQDNLAILNPDYEKPRISDYAFTSDKSFALFFSEPMDSMSLVAKTNYSSGDKNPAEINLAEDHHSVSVFFENNFPNGTSVNIYVSGLMDVNENMMADTIFSVMYFEQLPVSAHDLRITEIMADPSPAHGLPDAEFVEVYNRGPVPIDLKNFTWSDGTRQAKLDSYIIHPKAYAIVCDRLNAKLFSGFGETCTVNGFPSLNNSGDLIILKTPNGLTIDSLNFSDAWFITEHAREGGYTLELIDPENACAQETNWTETESDAGGTPGNQNSVFANKPDLTGPEILLAYASSPDSLVLVFNENLNKILPPLSAVKLDGQPVASSIRVGTDFRTLYIRLAKPLEKSTTYLITLSSIFDCAGNAIQTDASFEIAIPEQPSINDILINEILFNPNTSGVDFVEIYNNSSKFIDLKELYLGNLAGDSLDNLKVISTTHRILQPQSFLAITTNGDILMSEYPEGKSQNVLTIPSLPSMPDDEGNVCIVGLDSGVIDRFSYRSDMHSVFLDDDEGVALERVSISQPTDIASNWKSASAQSGFATPGYMNSNSNGSSLTVLDAINVYPEIFEPVNGRPDFTTIHYKFDKSGFVANVKIYDAHGRQIKSLLQNEILGVEGFFRWDGDSDNGTKAAIGNYMILVEVFNDSGQLQRFKKRVAVAAQF